MTDKPAKAVSASAIEKHVYKVFPNDMNSHNTVFGGMIMAKCDRLALVVAERHSAHVCVTAAVDSIHFRAPAKGNDTLLFNLSLNRSWGSSMEIGAKVGPRTAIPARLAIFCPPSLPLWHSMNRASRRMCPR